MAAFCLARWLWAHRSDHGVGTVADLSRRQGRRSRLLFASFSRTYRRCSPGFVSVADPGTVLSLHSKSPRKYFGALSGNIAFLRRAFLCAKRLAAWRTVERLNRTCLRGWKINVNRGTAWKAERRS